MKMKRRIITLYSIIMAVAIIICIFVGNITKRSYIDNVELEQYILKPNLKVVYCDMGYDEVTNRGYLDNNNIDTVNDLITEDTIILKVKLNENSKRKLYYECILSKVDVLEVYKGEVKKGDIISIFEPVDCGSEYQMLCTDGYSMMQTGKEYIIFLKQLKNTHYGKDKYVYAPSSTTYSKYEVSNKTPKYFTREELEEPEFLHTYNEVKEQEVYLYDKEDYAKYIQLKQRVLEKYS